MNAPSRALVAFSGGISSAVLAGLVQNEYAQVEGVHYHWMEAQRESAQRLADRLDLPLSVVDVKEEFDALVIESIEIRKRLGLRAEAQQIFEERVLFPKLLDLRLRRKFDWVLTGHRALLEAAAGGGRNRLLLPKDALAEEVTGLGALAPEQLASFRAPLGSLEAAKRDILAKEFGLLEKWAELPRWKSAHRGELLEAASFLLKEVRLLSYKTPHGVWKGEILAGLRRMPAELVRMADGEAILTLDQPLKLDCGKKIVILDGLEVLGVGEVWKARAQGAGSS